MKYSVSLLVTSHVKGRVFPADEYGVECTKFSSNNGTCCREKKCYGGAARRATVIKKARAARPGVLLIDTGSYFYGAGTTFAALRGAASRAVFIESQYDAWTFDYHEFGAGPALDEDSGAFLASYIAHMSADAPHVATKPVLSNYNIDEADTPSSGLSISNHNIAPPFSKWRSI